MGCGTHVCVSSLSALGGGRVRGFLKCPLGASGLLFEEAIQHQCHPSHHIEQDHGDREHNAESRESGVKQVGALNQVDDQADHREGERKQDDNALGSFPFPLDLFGISFCYVLL